jgi:hypothetical protein
VGNKLALMALLAGYALALLRQACGEARRSEQACLVSHLQALSTLPDDVL